MNYSEAYKSGMEALQSCNIEEAALDARLLLEAVCTTDRHDLFVHGDRKLTEEEEKQYTLFLKKREERIPLQHILGRQAFMGLDFLVNGDVLIPRQDTEVLVEEVMKKLHDGMKLLDMCTGSGCILLSLLHYSNHCTGIGADLSEKALSVARENAEQLGEKAEFIKSDLFDRIEDKYDIIVSNPPYIPNEVIPTLMPEVKDYEPKEALDGGRDGYDYYRKITVQAKGYLLRGGMLFFEIGCEQAETVTGLMQQCGYHDIQTVRDFAGNDRVVFGTLQE